MAKSPAPAFLLVGLMLAGSASAAPRWLRLGVTANPDTSAVVVWTDNPGQGFVSWRLPGGQASQQDVTGVATGSGDLGATYVGRIEGLQPDTEYEYSVHSGGQPSGWHRFRTSPAAAGCAPVRFAVAGDSRGEYIPFTSTYVPSTKWQSIAGAMALERPHFALHTGDFVREGDKTGEWAKEMPTLEALARTTPFAMAIGNHDNGPGEGAGANYNRLLRTPANNPQSIDDYFSFVAGNVLVIGLSNYTQDKAAQVEWLRGVLEQHRNDVDWRVVFFHRPPWSSGNHGSDTKDEAPASQLVPVFDLYNVDVVFNGHDHDYERFHPSRGGVATLAREVRPLPQDSGRRGEAEGTVYIVAGGGGALTDPLPRQPAEGSAVFSNHLHYITAEASGTSLSITVTDCGTIGLGGANCSGTLDSIVLEKPDGRCAVRPDAGPVEPDASTPEPDAGPVEADAGEPADAGVVEVDAGEPVDGGVSRAAPEEGCGCGAGAPAALALAFVAALAPMRRRRARG